MTLSDRIEQLSDPAAKDCDMDIDESAQHLDDCKVHEHAAMNAAFASNHPDVIDVADHIVSAITQLRLAFRAHLENTK